MITPSLRLLPLLLAPLLALPAGAATAPPDHWVGTWATADIDRPNTLRPTPPGAASVSDPAPLFGATDTTLRQVVHVSLGGPLVRIELSNQFGTTPLTLGAAHIALTSPGARTDISLLTANALTFSGQPSIIIPAGATILSDPVALALPAAADLTISLFLPAQTIPHITMHGSAYSTNFMAPGNVVGQKTLPPEAKTFANWFFLKAVDVKVPAQSAAVVAFGDSITDGTASTPDTNQRWPDFLARRLHADKHTANLGVLNLGISGNRVLHDGTGPSALARFDTDVLAQSGVRYLILLESINDIGHATDPVRPYDIVTAPDLIAGLTQLAERAHLHGIKVFGATLTPYTGAGYRSPAGEEIREAVNAFIRTSQVFDGVIDFEHATEDKAHPGSWNPIFDHGDHLHPSDAGLKAMGEAIDLKLFELKKQEKYDITHQP